MATGLMICSSPFASAVSLIALLEQIHIGWSIQMLFQQPLFRNKGEILGTVPLLQQKKPKSGSNGSSQREIEPPVLLKMSWWFERRIREHGEKQNSCVLYA